MVYFVCVGFRINKKILGEAHGAAPDGNPRWPALRLAFAPTRAGLPRRRSRAGPKRMTAATKFPPARGRSRHQANPRRPHACSADRHREGGAGGTPGCHSRPHARHVNTTCLQPTRPARRPTPPKKNPPSSALRTRKPLRSLMNCVEPQDRHPALPPEARIASRRLAQNSLRPQRRRTTIQGRMTGGSLRSQCRRH
jgi:hypothetical protein